MCTRTSPPACIRLFVLLSALPFLAAADDQGPGTGKPANHLARETSPYLLLHAHNPVDWYPWGPEAFAKAKAEDKPIFLSVGYSSCYWCHVMERESFEDPEIAKILNAQFISIKVDREERPDVDMVYMAALQAFGPGGWPMSLFLTPDGRPFFAGTYFPPRDRQRISGFLTVVTEVGRAWGTQRKAIEKTGDAVADAVRRRLHAASNSPQVPLERNWAALGLSELARLFDSEFGGFGFDPANPRRPKFPQAVDLQFLLVQHLRGAKPGARDRAPGSTIPKEAGPGAAAQATRPGTADPLGMVLLTLDRMARGGIRDHLDGGYHRYSTDRYWIVPHFEKMLYDNALLASLHLLAFEITRDARWRHEAEATFAFVERRMTSPEGGFYSALDAETNHEEGGYYVWSRDEVRAALGDGPDSEAFYQVYGLKEQPNFEGGRYVLHESRTRSEFARTLQTTPQELEARLAPLRARLLAAREKRPAPLCDDKILTGWNGLMIAAYADGYRVLKVETLRRSAEKAAGFLLKRLRSSDGRLLHTIRQGKAKLAAYLEDYAFLTYGLIRLHEATHDAAWLRAARELAQRMLADFEDREEGGFFFTSDGHESLMARAKDPFDGALPSGNSVAILDLLALHRATGEREYLDHAERALRAFSAVLSRSPAAVPTSLIGLEQYLDAKPAPTSLRLLEPEQPAKTPPQVVTARAVLAGEGAKKRASGSEVDAIVTLLIRDGWHIYANPAGLPEMKPTTLVLDPVPDRSVSLVKVSYPAGKAEVLGPAGSDKVAMYEGEVRLTAHLRLGENAQPGTIELSFRLSYQACNDRFCLAPAELRIPLSIKR